MSVKLISIHSLKKLQEVKECMWKRYLSFLACLHMFHAYNCSPDCDEIWHFLFEVVDTELMMSIPGQYKLYFARDLNGT